MQTEDVEIELPPAPCLNSLDSALNRLGMLATGAESRREYLLKDMRRQPYFNMIRINHRYVHNVSIGFRVRPVNPHVRYKPYTIKERHRTRSENNDAEKESNLVEAVVDDIIETPDDLAQLKKAKSLESIVAEGSGGVNLQNIAVVGTSTELDVVSKSIQNLKVG